MSEENIPMMTLNDYHLQGSISFPSRLVIIDNLWLNTKKKHTQNFKKKLREKQQNQNSKFLKIVSLLSNIIFIIKFNATVFFITISSCSTHQLHVQERSKEGEGSKETQKAQ
jgi:hypothetical protein